MSPEKTQKLFDEYPELFAGKDKPLAQSLMAFGIETEDGWFDLIENTCRIIAFNVRNNLHMYPKFEFSQIKEKFGTLRLYYLTFIPEYEDWKAEMLSARTWYKPEDVMQEKYKKYCEDANRHYSWFEGVTSFAEFLSSRTCEICGKKARTAYRGIWAKTVCPECALKEGYAYEDEEYDDEV